MPTGPFLPPPPFFFYKWTSCKQNLSSTWAYALRAQAEMYQKYLGSYSGPLPVAVRTPGWPYLVAGRTSLILLFALESQAVLVPWCLYFYSCRLNKLLHVSYMLILQFPFASCNTTAFPSLCAMTYGLGSKLGESLLSVYCLFQQYFVSRSNVTVFSSSCSVCISYSFWCQYPSPETSTLKSLSRNFLPINSSAGDLPVIVRG